MQLLECSSFHNLSRTFAALQVLLDILLLTWGASEDYEIVVKTLNCGYLNYFFLLFLEGVIFTKCFDVSTFTNVVKLDVENENVFLTLSNVAHVNVETHNVDPTLLDVVNFNVGICNVVSTLIWRCPTLRRRISQNTTLKQRYWPDTSYFDLIKVRAVSTKIGPLGDILRTLSAGYFDSSFS